MEKQNEPKTLKCCEECLKKCGACKNVPWCPLLGGKEKRNVKA